MQVQRALGAGLVERVLEGALEVPAGALGDRLPRLLGADRGRDQRLVGLDAAVGQPLAGLGRVHDPAVGQLALDVARAGLLRLGVAHHDEGPHGESVA